MRFTLPLSLLCAGFLFTPAAHAVEPPPELFEGMTAPPLTGITTTGETFDLQNYLHQGQYVLVDFWAGWCGPCIQQMPYLAEAMREVQNERFAIVTVSLDMESTRSLLDQTVAKFGLTVPIVADFRGWESPLAAAWGIQGIPANFLLSPEGVILLRDLHGEELVEIPRRFAQDPDFNYEPISFDVAVNNLPLPLTDDRHAVPVEPLQLEISLSNPQAAGGSSEITFQVMAAVPTGERTLLRDGPEEVVRDEEGNPVVFTLIETVEDEIKLMLPAAPGGGATAYELPLPPGTLMAIVFPAVWSPMLDRWMSGRPIFLEYSSEPAVEAWEIEEQGGVIAPESWPLADG